MATLLREIKAKINNLGHEFIPENTPTQMIVKGEIEKEIFYVNKKGIVQKQDTLLPFSVTLDTTHLTPEDDFEIQCEIEHISHKLNQDGNKVEQQFIIAVNISLNEKTICQSQYFLLRSTDTLNEKQPIKKVTLPAEKIRAGIQNHEENDIIPIPNFALLIDQKVSVIHKELESKLRREIEEKVRRELESKIRDEIEAKMYKTLEDKLHYEVKDRVEKQLNYRFAQMEEEKIHAKLEKKIELAKEWEEIRKRSIQQRLYGYKVKAKS